MLNRARPPIGPKVLRKSAPPGAAAIPSPTLDVMIAVAD
jgi:hypothetical protein